MEEVEIILRESVTDYLENLVAVLFEKEYFGFEEVAQSYVQGIYDFIEHSLPIFPARKTPDNLSDLGSQFIFYKANQTTSWYIFFENSGSRYIVTYITNNHSEIAKYLG